MRPGLRLRGWRLLRRGQDAQGPGAVHRIEAAACAELREYAVDPVAQPVVGEVQRFGDLPVLVLFQAQQDVDLALGEAGGGKSYMRCSPEKGG